MKEEEQHSSEDLNREVVPQLKRKQLITLKQEVKAEEPKPAPTREPTKIRVNKLTPLKVKTAAEDSYDSDASEKELIDAFPIKVSSEEMT